MNSIWPPSAANLAASRRLWPDPFLAPDVPPREQLERFLANPEAFDGDFSEQLAVSIEAQRALQHLRSRTASRLPLPSVPDDEIAATADPRNCKPGEIWLSNTEVVFWNGRKSVKRRIFDLPEFLILSKPIPTGNDEIVLAAPVTDAAVWPEECRSEDDIVVAVDGIGEFVAHLDIQVTVSLAQFRDRLSSVTDDDWRGVREAVYAKAVPRPGYHSPIPAFTEILRDRLRLQAQWLGATAKARTISTDVPMTVGVLQHVMQRWSQMKVFGRAFESSCKELAREIIGVVSLPVLEGLHAHGLDPARELVTHRFGVSGSRASILVTECVSPAQTLALAVIADPDGVLEAAEVLDLDNRILTRFSLGVANSTFSLPGGRFLLRLADGAVVVLENETAE